MAILSLRKAGLLLLTAVSLFLASHPYRTEGQNAPTIVEVYKIPRGVAYRVNAEPVGLTATTNLLYRFNRVYDKGGAKAPVIVLLDPRVPIEQIGNVDGTAGKAQLTNLRYFIFDRGKQTMTEIKFGSTIPYSTNPPIN